MKITKGKIILFIIVVYFLVFAIININKEKTMNDEILDKVIIVKDGKLNSKNEGKIVLVSGKIDYDELVTFAELDNLNTIKINRKVEDYQKYHNEKTNKNEFKWVERLIPLNGDSYLDNITSEEVISNIKIGDYDLDSYGLSLIPTDSYYSKQESIFDLTTTGISYERDPWEENLIEGDVRLTYKYYDIKKYPNMSILAIQKGNTFIPYQYDKKTSFYQVFSKKVDTKEKLRKELKENVKNTTKGKFLFIIMILGVGIFFIVDNKKR